MTGLPGREGVMVLSVTAVLLRARRTATSALLRSVSSFASFNMCANSVFSALVFTFSQHSWQILKPQLAQLHLDPPSTSQTAQLIGWTPLLLVNHWPTWSLWQCN
jgi:hypothetical protein